MKEYVPNWATKHNNPRHLKYDKIKSQTTKYAMSLLRTLQISNNDVNSLLSNNFPLSWLPTLNRRKVSMENKNWKTNEVLLLHETLAVIAVQIVIHLQFYIVFKLIYYDRISFI